MAAAQAIRQVGKTLQKRVWINLLLIGFAVALVLVMIYEPGKEPPPQLPSVSQLAPDAITRIAILRPNQAAIRFEKQAATWRMTAPRHLRAAKARLDDLLQFPATTSQRSYPVSDVDTAELGLQGDAIRLRLNDTEFVFGDTDAINGWRYVRVGDTVHLVEDRVFFNLRQAPLAWVDTRLLPEGAGIVALELPGVRLVLKEGSWQAVPARPEISADAIVQLVQRWQNASALSVHPLEAPDEYAGTIRVSLENRRQPMVFKFIPLKSGFELARPDLDLKYRLTEFQRNELIELQPTKEDS